MNAHKEIAMVQKQGVRMIRYLSWILAVSALIVGLLLVAAPGAWALDEVYFSGTLSYQSHFNNDKGDELNDLSYLDGAYFDGNTVLFFTLLSTHSSTYVAKLYWQAPGCAAGNCYGSVDIGNTLDLNFRIKTVVFNDVLYILYTPWKAVNGYSTNRIYYRMATVNYGEEGDEWNLNFSDEKSFPTAATTSPAIISFANVLNGKMYVIYTAGTNWYYISSEDGATFDPAKFIYSTYTEAPLGPGGTVFHVPDENEGWQERMMISYCPGGGIVKYFFFDGQSAYGFRSIEATGLSASSVRLWTGTVEGYTNDRYAIQAFIGSPHDGTNQTWHNIYHRQYIPSGPNGDQGTWSTSWSMLDLSNEDAIHCRQANVSDHGWTLIPNFSDPYGTGNTQMLVWIYYSRGDSYTWKIGGGYDTIKYRHSTFKSDFMVHDPDGDATASAGEQDMSSSMVVGVIEGTPPFPVNGGVPIVLTANVSTVELSQSTTVTTSTTWSVGGSVVLSFGVKKPTKYRFQGKLSAGLKYTHESATSDTITTKLRLYSYTDNSQPPVAKANPGDLGWVLVLKPEIVSTQFIVKAFDGHALFYDAFADEMRLILLQYGPGTYIKEYAYFLNDPAAPFPGTPPDTYPVIFDGMTPRPLSTDLTAWRQISHSDWSSYKLGTKLPTIQGGVNSFAEQQIVQTVSSAETWSPSASFTVSAAKLGFVNFGVEATANFSMDIKTATSMSQSLGFFYHIPSCSPDKCCIAAIDVDAYILVPNEDISGYNAPWISDDIRTYRKPKPWCLTYTPLRNCPAASAGDTSSRLAVQDIRGTLFFDRNGQNNDRVSGRISLTGINPDFSLDAEELVHVRFGNYSANSGTNEVVSRYFQGRDLIIELKQPDNPEASVTVKLSYDRRRSILDIDLNADHIDLLQFLQSYGLSLDNQSRQIAKRVPFRFFLGNRYDADAELDVHCTLNEQNLICQLMSKR